jgi:hypothetical protein
VFNSLAIRPSIPSKNAAITINAAAVWNLSSKEYLIAVIPKHKANIVIIDGINFCTGIVSLFFAFGI